MYAIRTMNNISDIVKETMTEERGYALAPDVQEPDGILVRSANLHDMDMKPNLLAIARAPARA